MTTLTRHRGNSLFDTVFSDLFNDEFITRPYMSAAKRNSQVLNRDEDWQIVFAIPGVKKHEVAVKVDDFVLSVSYDNKANTDQFNFVSSFSVLWSRAGCSRVAWRWPKEGSPEVLALAKTKVNGATRDRQQCITAEVLSEDRIGRPRRPSQCLQAAKRYLHKR